MKSVRRCYWDSTCFLAHLNAEKDILEGCATVLNEAEAGRLQLVISTITYAEVVYLKGHSRLDRTKQGLIKDFFDHSWILRVDVTGEIARLAQDLMWQHETLRAYDALHIATAKIVKADVVHGKDKDFLRVAQSTFDANVPIGLPPIGIQPSIDFASGQDG